MAQEQRTQALSVDRAAMTGYGAAILAAVLDYATKAIVEANMDFGQVTHVTWFFNLVHWRNDGAAFGLLGEQSGWQRYFFIIVAVVASIWLLWAIACRGTRMEKIGFGLILGGALGNLADRILDGAVLDWLDFHLYGWHWPAFNLADAAICAGVFGLIWSSFTQSKSAPATSTSS